MLLGQTGLWLHSTSQQSPLQPESLLYIGHLSLVCLQAQSSKPGPPDARPWPNPSLQPPEMNSAPALKAAIADACCCLSLLADARCICKAPRQHSRRSSGPASVALNQYPQFTASSRQAEAMERLDVTGVAGQRDEWSLGKLIIGTFQSSALRVWSAGQWTKDGIDCRPDQAQGPSSAVHRSSSTASTAPRRSSLIGMIGTVGNGAAGGTTEPAQSRSKSLKANRLRVVAALGRQSEISSDARD